MGSLFCESQVSLGTLFAQSPIPDHGTFARRLRYSPDSLVVKGAVVRDIYQVLRERELAIERVKGEIKALRSVIHLLAEEGDRSGEQSPASSSGGTDWHDAVLPATADHRH